MFRALMAGAKAMHSRSAATSWAPRFGRSGARHRAATLANAARRRRKFIARDAGCHQARRQFSSADPRRRHRVGFDIGPGRRGFALRLVNGTGLRASLPVPTFAHRPSVAAHQPRPRTGTAASPKLSVEVSASFRGVFGPFAASVDRLGACCWSSTWVAVRRSHVRIQAANGTSVSHAGIVKGRRLPARGRERLCGCAGAEG